MRGFKIVFVLLLALLLYVPFYSHTSAQTFSDVHRSFWAYHEIEWAGNAGIVNGYGDGSFKPNSTLTEAQFAAILADYLNINPITVPGDYHWAQSIYNSLNMYGLPLRGYANNNDSIKNRPVKRGTIARVLAATQGHRAEISAAVQFMYDHHISSGRNGIKTFSSYGVDETLTRAQAAVFFSHLEANGLTQMVAEKDPHPRDNYEAMAEAVDLIKRENSDSKNVEVKMIYYDDQNGMYRAKVGIKDSPYGYWFALVNPVTGEVTPEY
ncbi:S-layer homology domain-containing protein [Bacillus piscicola]|uniref:S-layer homology domain-containing protein n=1 Tax=Bacillus piscicola TaxID=1632684 RepID=UPI001F09CADF|nr:S-layer homology domain-containing protein [Bacillus piscicola]